MDTTWQKPRLPFRFSRETSERDKRSDCPVGKRIIIGSENDSTQFAYGDSLTHRPVN
jgi:hypothetical protein